MPLNKQGHCVLLIYALLFLSFLANDLATPLRHSECWILSSKMEREWNVLSLIELAEKSLLIPWSFSPLRLQILM